MRDLKKIYMGYDSDFLDYVEAITRRGTTCDKQCSQCNQCKHENEESLMEADYSTASIPGIKKVIFNNPATIILWMDGTRTVVKCCNKDVFNKETGFKTALLTKMFTKPVLKDLVNTYVSKNEEETEECAKK